jgi:hypothetical protein
LFKRSVVPELPGFRGVVTADLTRQTSAPLAGADQRVNKLARLYHQDRSRY